MAIKDEIVKDAKSDLVLDLQKRLGDLYNSLVGEDVSDADLHYANMIADVKDGLILDETNVSLWETLKDKTLTSSERKAMSKSTFCKPGERKYPVNSCGHAKSAMAYAKKYNESSSVISCIRRKASRLGCPFGKDEVQKVPNFGIFTVEYFDQFEDQELQQLHVGLDLVLQERSLEHENPEDHLQEVKNLQESLAVASSQLTEAELSLATKDDELALLQDETNTISAALTKAVVDYKKARIDHLAVLQKFDAEAVNLETLSKLEVSELEKVFSDTIIKIDIQKISDRLKSGLARNPEGFIADPTLGSLKEDKTHEIIVTKESLTTIQEQFLHIRMTHGQEKAEEWLEELKNKGLIPREMPVLVGG